MPTLGEWGLMLLGLLAAGLGMRRLRPHNAGR
ncbi:IPTL-CTERM sorting domain-containing protein [Ottowia thiooxydans]